MFLMEDTIDIENILKFWHILFKEDNVNYVIRKIEQTLESYTDDCMYLFKPCGK